MQFFPTMEPSSSSLPASSAEPASFAEIVDLWDSRADMARDLGVRTNQPALWRHRNNIPPEHWQALVAAGQSYTDGRRLISLSLLARLAADAARDPSKREAVA